MDLTKPRILLDLEFDEYAQEYLRSLPPEHFMEATSQSTQRKITDASFELIRARRPEFWPFGELLVQYPLPRQHRPGQVVPDNMVVLSEQPIKADTCFNIPLQPAGLFWALEYVSKNNKRKDYEKSFRKYERGLKVPYYLIFYPDTQDLSLFQLRKGKYVSVRPNGHGRYVIRRIEIELALLDGWVRYWYQDELLPLPAELQAEVGRLRVQLQAKDQQLQAKDQQLQAKDQQLQSKDAQITRMVARFRQQVEESARRRGRGDILTALPTTSDPDLLSQWLDELE